MRTRSRDLALRLAAGAFLVAGLAACGDDEPGPGTTPSPSPTESSQSPTETETETESATDEPDAAPATGPRITTASLAFNAPDGWDVVSAELPIIRLMRDPGSQARLKEPHGIVQVTLLPSGRSFTLDQMAQRSDAPGRRLDDLEVDGEQVYHFSESTPLESTETYGLWREGFEAISMDFMLFGSTKAEREELVASVLSSWEWRP